MRPDWDWVIPNNGFDIFDISTWIPPVAWLVVSAVFSGAEHEEEFYASA